MQDLSLHILDIVENSINAGAGRIWIRIHEDASRNILRIEISDNGRGMSREMISRATDPFFTTKKGKKTGLGIPLLAQAARECGGELTIRPGRGKGTTIRATFQHNHIDRKPIGDMGETLLVLIGSHPEIDIVFEHRRAGDTYRLSTRELKAELEGVPVNAPDVIRILKDDISQWLKKADNMI